LGLEKKTTVSKALAESSNFGENKTRTLGPALMLQAGCIYLGLITPCPVQKPSTPYTCPENLSPPVWKPSTPYTCPEDLSPPAQLQMPSQLRNTQNTPPD